MNKYAEYLCSRIQQIELLEAEFDKIVPTLEREIIKLGMTISSQLMKECCDANGNPYILLHWCMLREKLARAMI